MEEGGGGGGGWWVQWWRLCCQSLKESSLLRRIAEAPPPPSPTAATPREWPERAKLVRREEVRRVPTAPMGWPRATHPPWRFISELSTPRSLWHASTAPALLSANSNTCTAPRSTLADRTALGIAFAGLRGESSGG